jgi:uncharacterized protein (DUF433 family)
MTVLQLAPRLARSAPPHVRDLLSLKEAVVLADVPEKTVRKDVELGILAAPNLHRLGDGRLSFEWDRVFTIAAVYGNRLLNPEMRKVAIFKINDMCKKSIEPKWWVTHKTSIGFMHHNTIPECRHINIDRYIILDLLTACHNAVSRVRLYAYGLGRVEEKDDVLGGEAVFERSRLPVRHIGKMVENGENTDNILEDYPYLNEDDVRFASLYFRAHPTSGRPRKGGGSDDVHIPTDAR